MVPDKITHVDPTGQPQPPDRGPQKASDNTGFRRMLERLEELAKQSGTDSASKASPSKDVSEADAPETDSSQMDDTEEFMDAMKKADDDFVTVMDLRRKLEEAYRRSQP
ncbi:MAG: hypothetical protein ACYTGW_06450 [Planctomycetota bacterium]|jgi:flagellar hook-basal body complex protein FliE